MLYAVHSPLPPSPPLQWAYWDGVRQYEAKNRAYLQGQVCVGGGGTWREACKCVGGFSRCVGGWLAGGG